MLGTYKPDQHVTDLSVTPSDHAMLYVIVSPGAPSPRGGMGGKPLSLLAVSETVRSWPGGTGGHKLGLNYAPGFLPQRIGAKQGYDHVLWLLGDDKKITEAGTMNFFVVVQRDDGGAFVGFLVQSRMLINRVDDKTLT